MARVTTLLVAEQRTFFKFRAAHGFENIDDMVCLQLRLLSDLWNQNGKLLIDDLLVERRIFLIVQGRWHHDIGVRGRKGLNEFYIIARELLLVPRRRKRIVRAKHDDDDVGLGI